MHLQFSIFFCRVLDIRVAEIVETDFFQSVVFQYNLKMLCDEVWFDKFAHCIYIDIIQIFFAVSCKSPALRSGAVSLRVRILPSPGTICPEMADFRHTAILLFRCGLTRTVPVAGALRLVRSVRLLALAGRYGLANTRYLLTCKIFPMSLGLRCHSQGEIMRGLHPRMKGHGPHDSFLYAAPASTRMGFLLRICPAGLTTSLFYLIFR